MLRRFTGKQTEKQKLEAKVTECEKKEATLQTKLKNAIEARTEAEEKAKKAEKQSGMAKIKGEATKTTKNIYSSMRNLGSSFRTQKVPEKPVPENTDENTDKNTDENTTTIATVGGRKRGKKSKKNRKKSKKNRKKSKKNRKKSKKNRKKSKKNRKKSKRRR